MNSMKKFGLFVLVFAVALSVLGCASSGRDQTSTDPAETTPPKVTVEYEEVTNPGVDIHVTLPVVTKPQGIQGVPSATAQLRIYTSDSAWQNSFRHEDGCFAVVSSAGELSAIASEKLAAFEVDLTAYDDGFFAENRLVLIPRSSNSGSVTYQAKLTGEDGNVHIELIGQMPEFGTSDMAQWLVLVTLPNAEYGDLTVTVPEAGGNNGHVTK